MGEIQRWLDLAAGLRYHLPVGQIAKEGATPFGTWTPTAVRVFLAAYRQR
jgi:hypothetical protein